METLQKKSRIKSLEGLRAIAFLTVVFCHTGFNSVWVGIMGNWAVSVFFILSGFVAIYSQIDMKDYTLSFSYNFKYLIKKIKKLYPLVVVTTLALVIFDFM